MLKTRDNLGLCRKYVPTMSPQATRYLAEHPQDFSNKQHLLTMESRYSKDPYLNSDEITSSSRIAGEQDLPSNDVRQFQASVLKKVQGIEEETNQLLERKEKELYFLKVELKNNESRLHETESALAAKNKEISLLKQELSILRRGSSKKQTDKNPAQLQYLLQENQKLKQSLSILIAEKNEMSKLENKREYSHIHTSGNVQSLKQEVEQLRNMVTDMENMVYNCPSCFALRRELQELSQAYNCLIKEHSELKKVKKEKEQTLLLNITQQIQQNQNILRENVNLLQERGRRSYFKPKREKLNDSVAKRCRTLTDQF